MTMPGSFYCQTCGSANEDGWQYCARCGRPLSDGRAGARRIPGIAFLLNEAATPRMRDVIGAEHAAALAGSYAAELAALNPAPRRAAPASARAERPAVAPAVAAPNAPVRQAPPRRAPREPRDWSWLAEQQANIFLFAGAFLVVVAALIYVAYSGQAIGGALKMSLLVAYTVAFFAAGVACLRMPRVRMAGQVFFGVSALLVPLNFVAAYNIFSGDHLSATAMWLAGSLTTLVFYTLVASTGLGKHYAYSAGAALFSATAAGCAVSGVPLPWAPVAFLAVALAISLADLAVTERLRERITSAWLLEARALVPVAALFALGAALTSGWFDGTSHEFSHWFLLPSAALTLAFYAVEAIARRERYALWIAAAATAALTCSVVFGARLAPEHYALALMAAGAACYAAGRFRLLRLPASLGFEGMRRDAIVAARLSVAAGIAYAILSVTTAADPNSPYVQQTSWSLLLAFGGGAIFFAANLLAREGATDELAPALGFALTLTGALTAVVYGAGWRAEDYAFAFAAGALALLVASLPEVRVRLPLAREHDALQTFVAVAHAAALVAACVMAGAVYADVNSSTTFALQTRWTAVALPGALALFYAVAAIAQPRELLPDRELSFAAMLTSLYAAALATVFALGVSAEYYAFALIVPAIAFALVERTRSARLAALLPTGYGEQLIDAGRISVIAGIAVALAAVAAGASVEFAYRPQSCVFLPVAFVLAAAFFALDDERKPHYATSAALLASVVGAAIGVTYAAGAGAQWYGVTLVATGIALALVRPLAPRWLDADALSHAAVITVTASWLGFERVYVDYPRIAAAVHLAAAAFYAFTAFGETRTVALEARRQDGSEALAMPLAIAWLWASGLALATGYVHALRGVAFGQDAGAAMYSYPMLGFAVAIAAAAIAGRRWRPAFTTHMYAMALLADVAAISLAGGAHDLALLLTISAALSVALAMYENEPAIAVPAIAFGFGAGAAWQRDGAWPLYVIPALYSAIGLAAYALGFALRTSARRWSDALRAAGGLYAIVAPAAGFVALSNGTHHGFYGGAGFETSALYQWSTLAIALTGLLALAESSFARRGWVVIAGSGVLVVALMLELGRFGVRDVEAYTAVAGLYLLLVGTLGLWRFRLVPGAAEMAPLVEVLGAATILVPSAVQALHGGWRQLAVLLAEASAFLLLGAMLRRRGLLAAALTTFVVVTARVLFDAAQALPNWIIVLIAGMALLGVGVAILLGRERWSHIEKALLGWWGAMNAPEQHNGDAAHG